MFNSSGLSMEQAPPIKVILRFFLTGSMFGIVAGFMLFFSGDSLNNFADSTTLATVHILALGVMVSFMFGALFQMLPVICGVFIKEPENLSLRVNYALIFGTIFLIISFFNSMLYTLSTLFLLYAVFATGYVMLKELKNIKHSNSSRGMMIALVGLLFVVIFGLTLLAIRAGFNINIDYFALKTLHFNIALFGWITILIISVSFQVIEMFYVTPPYPKVVVKYLPIVISILLVLNIFAVLFKLTNAQIIGHIIALLITIYASITLIRLKQKKRAITDATVIFWVLGMGSLTLFTVMIFLNIFIELPISLLGILFSYFALSIVYAMSYKIVPFLVWFHLNAKGYLEAPMMHEVVHPKYARLNLYIFLISFALFLIAPFVSIMWEIGSIAFIASFFMLFLAIYRAIKKYYYVLENGKRFEFNF